jgi:diguanylate cyclase (GGDEF)-like protein
VHPANPFSPESRRLLAFSRDLFQAPDEDSVLELFQPIFFDFLGPRVALLSLKRKAGNMERYFDFEGEGQAQSLFKSLREHLREDSNVRRHEGAVALDVDLSNDDTKGGVNALSGSIISYAFPPGNPIGTFSALWLQRIQITQLGALQPMLKSLAELAGAALGNAADKCSLQREAEASARESKEMSRQFSESIQEHSEAMQEKDRIATTDVLTGLLNRRGFFERAQQAMKVAQRRGMKCAVVFADLDGLKAVNDTLGHDTGDKLLRAAGEVFAASFRDSDVVARLGGDEFSAFALDCASEATVLERVGESISRFHRNTTTPYRVSFSIGLVECDLNSSQSLENYLTTADNRMYQRKRMNRR